MHREAPQRASSHREAPQRASSPCLAACRSRLASCFLESADAVARLLGPPLVCAAVVLALAFSAAFLRLVAPAYGGLQAAAPLLAAAQASGLVANVRQTHGF